MTEQSERVRGLYHLDCLHFYTYTLLNIFNIWICSKGIQGCLGMEKKGIQDEIMPTFFKKIRILWDLVHLLYKGCAKMKYLIIIYKTK